MTSAPYMQPVNDPNLKKSKEQEQTCQHRMALWYSFIQASPHKGVLYQVQVSLKADQMLGKRKCPIDGKALVQTLLKGQIYSKK